jgi:protein gp37
MAIDSHIEWTESTWNPVTGCSKVSAGCAHCYAERMAKRLQAMGNPRYQNAFNLTLHPDLLDLPRSWKAPRRIFVNSMSDLFHEQVPLDFLQRVVATINATPWHTYQILTKRAERMVQMSADISWPANAWLGVTIERADYLHRIDLLRSVPAKVHFVSLEPLLGPLPGIELSGIDWVILGGESGPGARPLAREWVRDVRDQCQAAGVPFFFKQWGGVVKKRAGRVLDGLVWNQVPALA